MRLVLHKVVLKHQNSDDKFIGFTDENYPYTTTIETAHNFKTNADAEAYGDCAKDNLEVRGVRITYEWIS